MRLEITKELPKSPDLELAVKDFVSEVSTDIDKIGLYNETISRLVESLVYKRNDIDVWIAKDETGIKSFLIASIVKDMDGSYSYWFSHPYISKEYRSNGFIKSAFEDVKKRAKECLCKKIVIMTSRYNNVLNRIFDVEFKEYSVVLKTEIN